MNFRENFNETLTSVIQAQHIYSKCTNTEATNDIAKIQTDNNDKLDKNKMLQIFTHNIKLNVFIEKIQLLLFQWMVVPQF